MSENGASLRDGIRIASAGSKAGRNSSIELLRFAAAIGVVLIHFWPRQESSPFPVLDSLVVGTSRFAVPFFFAASGFFMSGRLESFRDGWSFARKWIRILFFWHALHALWFTIAYFAHRHDSSPISLPWVARLFTLDGLFEGVAWPLWYLHSLVFCALVTSLVPTRLHRAILLPLGICLYAIALFYGPWMPLSPISLPVPPIPFNPRDFLFTGLLPFAIGSTLPRKPSLILGWSLFGIGLVLQTTEILKLPAAPSHLPHEYFLGSVPTGVGLLVLGLRGEKSSSLWNFLGTASLPMYLTQMIAFSMLAHATGFVMTRLGCDAWASRSFGVALALPVFVWLCGRLASTHFWQRLHR